MSNLSVFDFEGYQVRFVGTAENPEWVAADITNVLVDKKENLILCDDSLPVLAWAPAETHPLDYYGSWVQE